MAKQPHLLLEEGDAEEIALVPGDPGRVDRIADACDRATVVSENREYRVVDAEYGGVPLTICSTGIGGPSTAIAVEELSRVGVETFVRVGTTGALQGGIEIGDMVVATGAAKEEGTSKRYESATYPAVPDYGVLSALVEAARARSVDERGGAGGGTPVDGASDDASAAASAGTPADVHVGPIVSDDAFYNETDEFVADWEAAGMLAIEMEAATLFSLARRRGRRAGAICTVDGNLVEGTQKGETADEELPPKARDNVGRAIEIALEAVTAL
ncbi:MAG: nucleoside phosphorylase [Salinigranum sp.]